MSKGKFDPLDPKCEDGGVACNDCICAGQCMSPPKSQPIANLQAAKPADSLGSLPVVAYEVKAENGTSTLLRSWYVDQCGKQADCTYAALTDHAQATAEIAKRDAEIDRLNLANEQLIFQIGGVELSEQDAQRELTTLRAKLAVVDGLAKAAVAFIKCHAGDPDITEEMCEKYAVYQEALATYEAAQGEKQ